eukprot:CAMPEP_0184665292 /NCGR_PEP_ID=MMETSP0308-20130426/56581_1 /TAXON_ID=38269 /ORGANISM="Gloeochaete witrockiana, Strain SAG 46.84" /LENGTH=64 /DNA_ID=CAMNT_0027109195 /DNA_START=17 /DNA_END=208 /DNA_ORIENTATION=-
MERVLSNAQSKRVMVEASNAVQSSFGVRRGFCALIASILYTCTCTFGLDDRKDVAPGEEERIDD